MSIESYEKQMAQLELYSKLADAISEIEYGAEGADAEKFLKDLMKSPSKKDNDYSQQINKIPQL